MVGKKAKKKTKTEEITQMVNCDMFRSGDSGKQREQIQCVTKPRIKWVLVVGVK